jgi:predicted Ser/Thr protein kinase
MTDARRCPACGSQIPPDAPQGLCPACLLKSEPPTAPRADSGSLSAIGGSTAVPDLAAIAGRFPDLEILESLGQGGMGAVYKARQPALDRLVALKLLRPEVEADPAFAERFTREARALARLNHPNIVAVYDFGRRDGLYYLLMEYVDGVNLRQLLRAGRLAPPEALAIVPQICAALEFAHAEGIVHRDIKPENLLVDRKGRLKIADFGIAKLVGGQQAGYTLTGPWQVVGTLHYMAPEQMEKPLSVDHRADIYSLGVVFYEMLTGELPLGRFAPPSQRVQLDVRLDHIVLRALEHEPERRYQHASEVKTEVESINEVRGLAAATVGASLTGPLPPGAAATMVGVALGILASIALIMVGIAILGYGIWNYPVSSEYFWGTFGAAIGCLLGGFGSLAGTWNSYRQLEGARDLFHEPDWTWFDVALLVIGLVGAATALSGLLFGRWLGWVIAYNMMLVGGIQVALAASFLIYRVVARRGARQELAAARGEWPPPGVSPGGFTPGMGPKLLLVALGVLVSTLSCLAGLGVIVYAIWALPPTSDAFLGCAGAALGGLVGGAGGLFGVWNQYRQWRGARSISEDPHWNWLDTILIIYTLVGLASLAAGRAAGPALGDNVGYALTVLGGVVTFQGLLFTVLRTFARRRVRHRPGMSPDP